jgi:NAD-dependent dihydropyrimidine dehydrogenase PreA subunit
LGVKLTDIGALALESKSEIPFNTICAVFAKSEAITALRKGVSKPDILAGLNEAIATRCLNLLKRVTIQNDFTITGGIAKNKGMVNRIEKKVGLKAVLAPDPQLMGALGAAIFAADRLNGGKIKEMKVHYGYTDATGDYFISVDRNKCDGCKLCVSACPAAIFEMAVGDSGAPKAAVRESARKRLAQLCPGHDKCKAAIGKTCHVVCQPEAIGHSW